MLKSIRGFIADEEGQGMVEYGLILGLVSVVAILTLTTLGTKVKAVFTEANSHLDSASAPPTQ